MLCVVKQERTKRNYKRTKDEPRGKLREVIEMKDRQRRFADEYLIDLNAEAAAVRAGYSPRYARGNAYKLVAKSGIKEYIEKRMAEKESELIADQNEVLRYLTAVMRGESTSEEIIVEGIGDGRSKARKLEKTPSEKDRLKAAELIGKRYGLFTDKIETDVDMDLNITIDYGDE